jgi:hypothetical protein
MLSKVMRHGFEFWEAPRNRGPVFEDVDPECQYRAELMRLRKKRFEALAQLVALVSFADEARGERLEARDEEPNASAGSLSIDHRASNIEHFEKKSGALRQRRPTSAKVRYAKKKEDPYDRSVWGDLADLSDEEPVEVLEAMGIARDEETQERRGFCEPDIAAIQDRVMQMAGITQQEFFEPNRRWDVAVARLVSMTLCRTHTNRTIQEIARAHDRNDAAVSRAVKRVAAMRQTNAGLARKIMQLEAEFTPMAVAA